MDVCLMDINCKCQNVSRHHRNSSHHSNNWQYTQYHSSFRLSLLIFTSLKSSRPVNVIKNSTFSNFGYKKKIWTFFHKIFLRPLFEIILLIQRQIVLFKEFSSSYYFLKYIFFISVNIHVHICILRHEFHTFQKIH